MSPRIFQAYMPNREGHVASAVASEPLWSNACLARPGLLAGHPMLHCQLSPAACERNRIRMSYSITISTVLLLLFGVIELVMRQGAVARSLSASEDDRGSTRLMLIIWIPAIAALFTTGFGPRLTPWTQWLGIALGGAGIVLRIVAFRALGAYYTRTLVTVTEQGVVQHGPYRYIRHPGYLSALLTWFGAAAGFGFVLPPLIELALLVPVYSYRIGVEERMLLRNLGSEYATYKAKTWRLLPFVF